MKKRTHLRRHKLKLNRQTLRVLSGHAMAAAAGGSSEGSTCAMSIEDACGLVASDSCNVDDPIHNKF